MSRRAATSSGAGQALTAAAATAGRGKVYAAKHLKILQAAAALFADQGYHQASIRELARLTGRSLAGLYYYFSGKEELLFQIQHHCYTALLEDARKVMAESDTPYDRLVGFISHHIAYFRRHMNEMKVLAHEDLTLKGTHGRRLLEIKREYSRLLMSIVSEYADDKPQNPTRGSPEIAAFVLFGMMNWLYTWPRRLRRLPPEDLAEQIAQIFLCGYPGCPETSLPGMRKSIVCAAGEFWKGRNA